MDTNLSIFSNYQTIEFELIDNVLYLDDVSNSNVEAEFNTDNIVSVMSLNNNLKQFLEPFWATRSSTQEESKNESRTAMESMQYADGLHHTAAVSSLYRDNSMVVQAIFMLFHISLKIFNESCT